MIMMTKQDWVVCIENCAKALCDAGKADEVTFILRTKGHDARSAEDLLPGDFDVVFDDLFQREADLRD